MKLAGLTTCSTESLCIFVHNEFKFLCVSGSFSLEIMNTPGTATVRGSNRIKTCFFFSNGKYFISKTLSAYDLSAYGLLA